MAEICRKSAGFVKGSKNRRGVAGWLNPDLSGTAPTPINPPIPGIPTPFASFGDPIWQAFFRRVRRNAGA